MKSTLHINPLFGEGCVLQSGMPVRIWGGGRPGSTIEVSVADGVPMPSSTPMARGRSRSNRWTLVVPIA